MAAQKTSATQGAWDAIAREKRLDKLVRTICTAAWAVTFLIVAGYAWIVWQQVAFMRDALGAGAVTRQAMLASATPLLVALGALALLIATLSTIGVFLRFRSASMQEIQLRLAALEEMMANER